MSKALEDIINEFFELAADLLHNGEEETALKVASLLGKLAEVMGE